MFTDIEGYGLMMGEDEARAVRLVLEHRRVVRGILPGFGGREQATIGDAFVVLFDNAASAVECALAIQDAFRTRNLRMGPADRVYIRIGVHVGDVIHQENDIYGESVNLAARVQPMAQPGGVCVTEQVLGQLGDPDRYGARSIGRIVLKHIHDPPELFYIGSALTESGEFQASKPAAHNLPRELASFVGRRHELRELEHAFAHGAFLVTLLGAGGAGKTTLARRFGATALNHYPGGVCFADLSAATTSAQIAEIVARTLDVPLHSKEGDPIEVLGHAIAARGSLLLILDNFEQATSAGTETVGRWMQRATSASFIVTSRERLRLRGEKVVHIGPLPVPEDVAAPLDEIARTDAVRLFVERARAVRSDFVLTEANASDVAELVRRLDGLPLAIELAAARVRVVEPAQLILRLGRRLDLLAGRGGDAPTRQATMRGAVDWSWELLEPWERSALAQCAVFVDGFALEDAERVVDLEAWPTAPWTLDVIEALVDKSLLRAVDPRGPRFAMYGVIRDYALEKLTEGAADQAAAEARHGAVYARFGSDAFADALVTDRTGTMARRLRTERANIEAAVLRAIDRDDGALAAPLAVARVRVADAVGPYGPAYATCEIVRSLPGMDEGWRARVDLCRARMARRMGRREALDEALAIAESLGDVRLQACIHTEVGNGAREHGELEDAGRAYGRALVLARAAAHRPLEGIIVGRMAVLALDRADGPAGRKLYAEALAIHREVGNRNDEAVVLCNMGLLDTEDGRPEDAERQLREALAIDEELGNVAERAIALGCLGGLFAEIGRHEEALEHFEAALALNRRIGARRFEGHTIANLGFLHDVQGELPQASARYREALVIARDGGDAMLEAWALASLAEVERLQGHAEEAAVLAAQSLEMATGMSEPRSEGMARGVAAMLALDRGALDEAREAADQAAETLRNAHLELELAVLQAQLVAVDLAKGDRARAVERFEEATRIADRLAAPPDSRVAQRLRAARSALG